MKPEEKEAKELLIRFMYNYDWGITPDRRAKSNGIFLHDMKVAETNAIITCAVLIEEMEMYGSKNGVKYWQAVKEIIENI